MNRADRPSDVPIITEPLGDDEVIETLDAAIDGLAAIDPTGAMPRPRMIARSDGALERRRPSGG